MVYLLDIDFSLLLNFNNSHDNSCVYVPHYLKCQDIEKKFPGIVPIIVSVFFFNPISFKGKVFELN